LRLGETGREETPRLAPRGDRESGDPSLALGETGREETPHCVRGDRERGDPSANASGRQKRGLEATKREAQGDKKRLGVRGREETPRLTLGATKREGVRGDRESGDPSANASGRQKKGLEATKREAQGDKKGSG